MQFQIVPILSKQIRDTVVKEANRLSKFGAKTILKLLLLLLF